MEESTLLEIDGLGNVLLGLPLVFYPTGVARLLGIPFAEHAFHPMILSTLLLGIGISAPTLQRLSRGALFRIEQFL